MQEDFSNDFGLGEESEDDHRGRTARTGQGVDEEDAVEQLRPGQRSASAARADVAKRWLQGRLQSGRAKWRFALQLGDAPLNSQWSYALSRDVPCYRESLAACIEGKDLGSPGIVAFSISSQGGPTAVQDDEPRPSLPGRLRLGAVRAFPNPFNARTQLRFELRQDGPVTVTLYDLRGRQLRRLLAGRSLAAGTHHLDWDGRDAHGAAVASGVYYWRIESAGEHESVPVVLVE